MLRIRTPGVTWIVVLLASNMLFSFPATATEDHRGAVSALGRLQPQDGILHIGIPSTPAAVSGSLLSVLHVKEGDALYLTKTPEGYQLVAHDPDFEKTMKAAEGFMSRYRNAMRELAK